MLWSLTSLTGRRQVPVNAVPATPAGRIADRPGSGPKALLRVKERSQGRLKSVRSSALEAAAPAAGKIPCESGMNDSDLAEGLPEDAGLG
jgi:hypothetical protein